MIATWYAEAGKYDVLPIDSRGTARLVDERPQLARRAISTSTTRGTSAVSNKIAARVLNRPHSITATVELANGAEGVLVAQGGSSGGYALYVKDHKLHYAYNFLGIQQYHLASDATIGDGRHELRFEFEPTGKPDFAHGKGTPARAQLYVDGKLAGADRPPGHHPARHRDHRRPHLRARRRLDGDDRLPGAVRLQRGVGKGGRRRLGRAHRGPRRQAALDDGAPVERPTGIRPRARAFLYGAGEYL